MRKGTLYVFTGPSGAGKGTVLSRLLSEDEKLFFSISATTRAPRPGEKDGVQYYFLTKEDFEAKIAANSSLSTRSTLITTTARWRPGERKAGGRL